jgi:predicted  nucleic acid-binding Zn-ribbon protein
MATLAAQLVELQRIDTLADQLRVVRERTPLRAALAEETQRLGLWERRQAGVQSRITALEAEIEGDERRGAEIAAHLERLNRQLKTVIAPREAEALMHEIATLTEQRDDLDIRELEAMEEEATLEGELAQNLGDEPALRADVSAAAEALAIAVADIEAQLEALEGARIAAVADIPADVMARYERARPHLGVVVSRLEGKQCTGCHLDLSAAEIDSARAEAAETGFTDCPQCGRILVLG